MPRGSNWKLHPPSWANWPTEGSTPPGHRQATAQEAAERGWYYRTEQGAQLEPDTRRCGDCGEVMFAPLPVTQLERDTRHPLSTNVLLGEPSRP